jgi:hypothetical protein
MASHPNNKIAGPEGISASMVRRGMATIMDSIQAGGQRVFKKLDPERFPLSGEGVLPPVLVLAPVRTRDRSRRA